MAGLSRIFAIVIFLITIIPASALAQTYYADLEIEVQNDGSVVVEGITNNRAFSSGTHQELTSKEGIYWILNISPEEKYSDYIVSIRLPEGTEFNYLKASGRSRISYDGGIRIIAAGSGEMSVVVQYQIKDIHESQFWFWFSLTVIALIILGIFAWKKFFRRHYMKYKERKEERKGKTILSSKKEKTKKEQKPQKNNEKLELLKRTLSENQVIIVNLLLEANGELTQKQVQHRSGLAKATLSRNIDLLAKKNIILKQSRGMTNMIILNKEMVE
ncbi:MAG: helix-turn-helix transcriptional regulator [Candidatus Nanoarchaeia archaeon]